MNKHNIMKSNKRVYRFYNKVRFIQQNKQKQDKTNSIFKSYMSESLAKIHNKRKSNWVADVPQTERFNKLSSHSNSIKTIIMGKPATTKQMEQLLKRQIKKAKQLIYNINKQYTIIKIPVIRSTNEDKYQKQEIQQLRNMQNQIRRRNIEIQILQEQIKSIQNGCINSSKKLIDTYLTEQLQVKSHLLQKSITKYKERQEIYTKCKNNMNQIQHLYISKCLQEAVEPITYDQFRYKYLKQRARINSSQQYSQNRSTNHKNKKLLSERNTNRYCSLSVVNQLKQKDFNTRIYENKNHTYKKVQQSLIPKLIQSNKFLKDIQNKKNVAETALKAAKRKHIIQMHNYESKLQFLSDEYQQLQNKENQKIKQLGIAQRKFNQSRNKQNKQIIGSKKLLFRKMRTQTN